MKHFSVLPLEDLKALRKRIINPNKQVQESMTGLDKFALRITEKVGSAGFFIIILVWTILWLGWNTLAPSGFRFDPFPGFVLWLFISNMIQIFLMPLIMIGQNLQSQHAEIRAESDYEINTKAELEIETILMHLENQNQLMLQILEKLDKKNEQ